MTSKRSPRRLSLSAPQSKHAATAAIELEKAYAELLDECKAAGADCTQLRICIGNACKSIYSASVQATGQG